MKLTALAAHTPEAVRAALAARGWDGQPARFAAVGLRPVVVLLDGVSEQAREALVAWAARGGLDVLTGEGWALVAGAASRLAPLARPDRAPADLAPLVGELGRFLAAHAEPPAEWVVRGARIPLDRPAIIGIINVTPDSFSDGGRYSTAAAALRQADVLKAAGCALLDIGGESTRPGAKAVTADEEVRRVVPLIETLVRKGLGPVSVDTRKAVVARAALDAGAAVVNDVSGFRADAESAVITAQAGAGAIVMHMRGTPETMDGLATYQQVAAEVAAELLGAVDAVAGAGVAPEAIAVDPGFGFAKTAEQNLRLLDELATIVALGYPVVVGPSRKRFLGFATGQPVEDRDRATAVACALAYERGARLFRVHDAALAREALALAAATTSELT